MATKKSEPRSVSKSIRRRYVVSGKVMVISGYRAKELREKGKKVHLAKSQTAPGKKKPAKKKPTPKKKPAAKKKTKNPDRKAPKATKPQRAKRKNVSKTDKRRYVVGGKSRSITPYRAEELRKTGKKVRLAKTQKTSRRASTRGMAGIGLLGLVAGAAVIVGLGYAVTRKRA